MGVQMAKNDTERRDAIFGSSEYMAGKLAYSSRETADTMATIKNETVEKLADVTDRSSANILAATDKNTEDIQNIHSNTCNAVENRIIGWIFQAPYSDA
ncbi:hypothetical protein N7508_009135 [Penicillium antarcticum]|uniref:uncharacterized protein n=1 Tax=Penicillium antarcticum TaxID=416450 RepID=UPI002386B93B|nr:uncharacterized protein N7508_009135 [Penicillium antarcticum]KAJ5294314.1 hypothetical protein N7508_009135 [Penicillium antarcticum]